MADERKRILDMLETGVLTPEQAIDLLRVIGESPDAQQPLLPPSFSSRARKSSGGDRQKYSRARFESAFDFLANRVGSEDIQKFLKRDLGKVGDRLMDGVQTAVERLRNFDFEQPFGTPQSFQEQRPIAGAFHEISVDILNGSFELVATDEESARLELNVQAYGKEDEHAARSEFVQKFTCKVEGDRLRIASDMKTTAVHARLYAPRVQYSQIAAKVANGSVTAESFDAKHVQLKTLNGRISVRHARFVDVEAETLNGGVHIQQVDGYEAEIKTVNGRIYVEGALELMTAHTVSGHVTLSAEGESARKIEATALSGNIELYIPRELALKGNAASSIGKIDVQLSDVAIVDEQESMILRRLRFTKDAAAADASPLIIQSEAKAGSILICYNRDVNGYAEEEATTGEQPVNPAPVEPDLAGDTIVPSEESENN